MSAEPVRIRWGLGDVGGVWILAVFVGPVALGSLVAGLRGRAMGWDPDGIDIAATGLGALIMTIAALEVLARRRGRGSLCADFGLALRGRDWPWLGVGLGLAVIANGCVLVINAVAGSEPQQAVTQAIESSTTMARIIGAVSVVIFAPLAEELLFRGLLLRSLLRRTGAVRAALACGAAFAAGHLIDPSAAPFLAPLALVGVVASIRAVRTGELSQSILLHGGFNLFAAVSLLAGWA